MHDPDFLDDVTDERTEANPAFPAMLDVASGRRALARRIFEAAHLTGEFRLRSGATSDEYFDKYLFESEPALLADIAEALASLLPAGTEAVAGLELGGVPIATMVSQSSGVPTRFVRKQAKEYGTCRLAEGGDVDGLRLVVIEDVVTSGGQVIESCDALRAAGATVTSVLCVVDREAGGSEALAAHGLALSALFTASQLHAANE